MVRVFKGRVFKVRVFKGQVVEWLDCFRFRLFKG